MRVMKDDPEMLEEYDFSEGVRGKYAAQYAEGTNIVRLDPELMAYFPDSDTVNEALRMLVKLMKKHERQHAKAVK